MELVKIKAVVKEGVAMLEGGRLEGIALPFAGFLANTHTRCAQFLEVNGYKEIQGTYTENEWEIDCEDLREIKAVDTREVGKIVEDLKALSCVKNVWLPEVKGFVPVIDLAGKYESTWLTFVYFQDGRFHQIISDGKNGKGYSLPYARRLAKAEALNIRRYSSEFGDLVCVVVESDFGECFGSPQVKKVAIELSECVTGKSFSNKE